MADSGVIPYLLWCTWTYKLPYFQRHRWRYMWLHFPMARENNLENGDWKWLWPLTLTRPWQLARTTRHSRTWPYRLLLRSYCLDSWQWREGFGHRQLKKGMKKNSTYYVIRLTQPDCYRFHPCYKTDFLYVKGRGPKSYFRYTILDTKWAFCPSMRKKIRVSLLLVFLENTCFVCNSMGNGSIKGVTTSIWSIKRFISQKRTLFCFCLYRKCYATISEHN